MTPDLAAARRFYGDLFGWSFRDVTPAGYAVAYTGSHPVAGIVQRAMPHGAPKQPAWLTFLAVRDVAVAKRAVLKGGGTLLAETRNYPNRGTQAVFADPQGAVFAVLAALCVLAGAAVVAIASLGPPGVAPFIYFQF